MKTRRLFWLPAVILAALAACATVPKGLAPLAVVETVDLQRYLGRWYEIARLPQSFEKDLVGVTAEYSLRGDGRVQVVNSGFKNGLDGAYTEARAVAWVPDPSRPGALKVQFFWPFTGDYLIFGLDRENYQWAVVGDDSRNTLWFLSRTPEVDDTVLARMKDIALDQGYDLANLYRVPQKQR